MELLTCPSGHKLNPAKFICIVDTKITDIDDAVIFTCPGGKRGHTFTLRKAVASGMFTIEQAALISSGAKKHLDNFNQQQEFIEKLKADLRSGKYHGPQ